jgi:hypothetical protein
MYAHEQENLIFFALFDSLGRLLRELLHFGADLRHIRVPVILNGRTKRLLPNQTLS